MNIFLKAKHWQIFLLSFILPFIIYIIMVVTLVSNFMNMQRGISNAPDTYMIYRLFTIFPIIILIFMGVLYGWFWSVAVLLQKKVPEGIMMKIKKFKIFFFYNILYMLLFMSSFFFMFRAINFVEYIGPSFMLYILPFHFFAMFCSFYMLYFVAKTFKTVELQREVKFSDFAGEFFMIWFYPIGIWILQPKINKMIDEEE